MRRRLLTLTAVLALGLGLGPANTMTPTIPVPVIASDNVGLVAQVPDALAISTAFATDEPLMYVSTLKGISVYDISNPRMPLLRGFLPMVFFQNEAVTLGERFAEDDRFEADEKFVIVGIDLFQVTPLRDDGGPDADVTATQLIVVEVTDPSSPQIVGQVDTTTSTHTVTCVDLPACTHAYTAGSSSAFDVIDLTDFRDPEVVATVASPAGQGLQGHDWDIDEAGIAWHVGGGGAAAFDVSNPADPVLLNSTTEAGRQGVTDYNNFILHNSIRPDAARFEDREDDDVPAMADGRYTDKDAVGEDIRPGEVLLVTEEDYVDVTCASEGSFSTWHVTQLDASINPDGTPGGGTIAPLDKWNTEVLDTGQPTPAGAFCSAHYFDYHQDGFVAQGWYQQGLRILDVRDPLDIKQVGYYFTGVTETWGAYWVPEYDEDGQTGAKTNLVYTNDPVKGLEILEVELPDTEPDGTRDLTAPILPQWLVPDPTLAVRASDTWGTACPLSPLN